MTAGTRKPYRSYPPGWSGGTWNLVFDFNKVYFDRRRLGGDIFMCPTWEPLLDPAGKPDFANVIHRMQQTTEGGVERAKAKCPAVCYVFDCLYLDGRAIVNEPLMRRREWLEDAIRKGSAYRVSEGVTEGAALLEAVKQIGLEGIIAKQAASEYEPGRRADAWLKIKCLNGQEFVIGGYTAPKGGRLFFGAILVGYYDREKLIFASKVGTGFDHEALKYLYARFQKLKHADCPFANLPEKRGTSGGLTAGEMTRRTWVEPKLVCQIAFTEWTRDGHLRHPAFLGLREDKKPQEVIRETAAR